MLSHPENEQDRGDKVCNEEWLITAPAEEGQGKNAEDKDGHKCSNSTRIKNIIIPGIRPWLLSLSTNNECDSVDDG
jgi:hypothetical protein